MRFVAHIISGTIFGIIAVLAVWHYTDFPPLSHPRYLFVVFLGILVIAILPDLDHDFFIENNVPLMGFLITLLILIAFEVAITDIERFLKIAGGTFIATCIILFVIAEIVDFRDLHSIPTIIAFEVFFGFCIYYTISCFDFRFWIPLGIAFLCYICHIVGDELTY